jgi:UDP-N-acetylmuramate--alanine ligase
LEACEYDRSFDYFSADLAVITNIEEEHLDYFKGGLDEIENAFADFLSILRPGATVVTADHDPSAGRVIKKAKAQRPDLVLISLAAAGQPKINRQEYQFFGDHNFRNAQMAVETTFHFGVSRDDGWQALKTFRGARRRLEYIGLSSGALVYDDYGHHPTEILADIKALKTKYPDRQLTIVFQPHQVSRTKLLFGDFVASLGRADSIIVTDIHKVAGREEKVTVTGKELAEAIAKKHKNTCYVALPYDNIVEYLEGKIGRGDVLLTAGATNIYKVAKGLVDGSE